MRKNIPDFPDYSVHIDGYIISHKNGEEKVMVGGSAGRTGHKDYLMVTLREKGKQVGKLVHRLVAQAFVENPNNLPQVNHIDGDKRNNKASNLEWVSASDNQKHAVKIGLWSRPTDKHFARMWENSCRSRALFTLEEGTEILEMKDSLKLSCSDTARIVGCSISSIKRLVRGDTIHFKDGTLR